MINLTSIEGLTFEIYGDYAMFKKPWCNNQQQSYLIPPKTTLLGILGGILGYSKEEYLERLSFDKIKIGIEILKRPTKDLIGYNFMHGKDLRSKLKNLSNPYRNPTNKGSRSPTRLEYLKNVGYRIYLILKDIEIQKELFNLISNNKYHFPPFLGQVNLFASIFNILNITITTDNKIEFVNTVAPAKIVDIKYLSQDIYHIENIPNKFNSNRTNPEYISIAFFDQVGKNLRLVPLLTEIYCIGNCIVNNKEKGVVLY